MDETVHNDEESFEILQPESSTVKNDATLSQAEVTAIREDLPQLKLQKNTTLGLPTFEKLPEKLGTPSITLKLSSKRATANECKVSFFDI